MIKLDLITGFLGAGKTTFLLRYAPWLLSRGEKLGILVYDHGAMNVDMPLLRALQGERCELETLAAGCGADCHRRRFRTRLIEMGMRGYDRVLIEPSGIFDMDELFDTLQEPPLDHWYSLENVIDILDARLEPVGTSEEDFFLASQAACAGRIVLSRFSQAGEAERARSLERLERAARAIRCGAPLRERVLAADWDRLRPDAFAALSHCGHYPPDYVKTVAGSLSSFQSLSYLHLPFGSSALREKVQALLHDRQYGEVARVKGFFPENGRWYQLNATGKEYTVEEAAAGRAALLVIGKALEEDRIGILLTGHAPEHHIL